MSVRPDLQALRRAGQIAGRARDFGATLVRSGALLRDVCDAVEERIKSDGAGLAFPVQTSRNAIAAHYCPGPNDDTRYVDNDVAKLDVGVHVDGWVVDTATTILVGNGNLGRRLLDAVEAALGAALKTAGPGVPISKLSAAIDQQIRSFGVRPMRDLCGHGVGRWRVHCSPAIPNTPEAGSPTLEVDSVVAVEPFATLGKGLSTEEGRAEIFRVDPETALAWESSPVLRAIRQFRGLPFSRRQLSSFLTTDVEATLHNLDSQRRLQSYPPLVESTGAPVAQMEHTIYIGTNGAEVLTL